MASSETDAQRAQGNSQSGLRTLLARDIRVTGNLFSEGTVEIEGQFDGDVEARSIVIASGARVTGRLKAATVDLRGTHQGEIEARSVTMHAEARVNADIRTGAISIETGAQVNGQIHCARVAGAAVPG